MLYIFLSPMASAFFSDVGNAMKEPALRFFGVEHIAGMIVAITILHIGRARSKKAGTPRLRHRRVWVSTLIALTVIAASIPWPFLRYGRPLLRV
jgi:cation transport ATPase